MMFLLLFLVTLGIGLLAQWHVKSTFARHSRTGTAGGYSGAEVANQILTQSGIHDVDIVAQEGMLGDHYDPTHKRLVLSNENYYGTSAAALGVAAHECGHAIQHQKAYAPLKWRMASVGITNVANQMVLWIPLLGMATGMLAPKIGLMAMAIAWGVLMAFNLITLPVEFDASRRAKLILGQMGFIRPGQESAAVNSVLTAAGWTYVAAFISSLLYFLWYLLPLLGGSRERE